MHLLNINENIEWIKHLFKESITILTWVFCLEKKIPLALQNLCLEERFEFINPISQLCLNTMLSLPHNWYACVCVFVYWIHAFSRMGQLWRFSSSFCIKLVQVHWGFISSQWAHGYPHKPTFPYVVTNKVRWEEKKQVTEKQALIDYLVTEKLRKGKVSAGVIFEQRRKSSEGDGWTINICNENSSNAGDSKCNAPETWHSTEDRTQAWKGKKFFVSSILLENTYLSTWNSVRTRFLSCVGAKLA